MYVGIYHSEDGDIPVLYHSAFGAAKAHAKRLMDGLFDKQITIWKLTLDLAPVAVETIDSERELQKCSDCGEDFAELYRRNDELVCQYCL